MKFQSRSNKRWKFVKKEHTSWLEERGKSGEQQQIPKVEEANIHRFRFFSLLLCFSTSKTAAQNSQRRDYTPKAPAGKHRKNFSSSSFSVFARVPVDVGGLWWFLIVLVLSSLTREVSDIFQKQTQNERERTTPLERIALKTMRKKRKRMRPNDEDNRQCSQFTNIFPPTKRSDKWMNVKCEARIGEKICVDTYTQFSSELDCHSLCNDTRSDFKLSVEIVTLSGNFGMTRCARWSR